MSAPVEISLDNLAHLPVWVGWREEQRDGDLTKVPYDPRTGGTAKPDDSTTWATRGEAEFWSVANRGGVGIVLSQINRDCNLCGIDLDTCRDPTTGTFQGWAGEVIARFATYTEISPSGTGAKLYFIHTVADFPAIERLFDGSTGKQFKNGGGKHCPAIEVYRTRRYFTVTNESVGPTDILRQVPLADLEWLIRDAGPKFKGSQKSGSSGNDQSRSGKAFRKGAALKAAGYSYAAMRDALLADEDPEIAEWARTKGLSHGEREMRRIYENAGDAHANSRAGKKIVAAPLYDAEVGPVMKLLDDVLSSVDAAEPPMRDASGWPVEIQCRETAGLHELSSDSANDEADENSRLPPPKNLLLTKHDKESLEILIGDHVSFIRKTKIKKDDGTVERIIERAVAPQAKFRHPLFEISPVDIAPRSCRADHAVGFAGWHLARSQRSRPGASRRIPHRRGPLVLCPGSEGLHGNRSRRGLQFSNR